MQIVERETDILIHLSNQELVERLNNVAPGNMYLLWDIKEHTWGELALLPGGAKLYKYRTPYTTKDGLLKFRSPGGWWVIRGYVHDMRDVYAAADALMSGCTTSTW